MAHWSYWLIGNLGWGSLPFYSGIATLAAGMEVFAAIAIIALITVYGKWGYLWREWLTSLDHKKIGIMYIVIALVMLTRAISEAALMRLHQALAINDPGILPPEHFGQLFSTHGSIMIFFMAMPFLAGIINFAMPLQIGSRDVAFPMLNAISLWLTGAGAGLVIVSLVIGKFSTGGWSGYPPFTELAYSPGEGVDYWIWSVTLGSISTTLASINILVTIYKMRAEGMGFFRMPLFCWTTVCVGILMAFAMPALTVATAMLALDRYLDFHFFTADHGGDMMNYANLFWLFGHPEVYILILPAFGIYSEVISTFSGKKLYGYTSLVVATMAISVLSFTVWLHHFFTMGQSADVNAFFGIATMVIGVPTGVKVYDWLLTMYRGRLRFTTPMLFSIVFLFTFVVGGMSGVLLANPPVDYATHNSLFLIAHFHNMLIPGTLFGLIAGYQYWFPKAFGFRLDERWGRIAFVCWSVGFYLAFMPLYALGLMGVMRRTQEVYDPAFAPWLYVAFAGALLLLGGLASLVIQMVVSVRNRKALAAPGGDPWDGRSLEWSIPSPPPEYNFAVPPHVHDRDAFAWMKKHGTAYLRPASYEDIEMPLNSFLPAVVGIGCGVLAFALTWHIWWLAVFALCLIWGAVAWRSYDLDTTRIIPADEVRRVHEAWLSTLATLPATRRAREATADNTGLAEQVV